MTNLRLKALVKEMMKDLILISESANNIVYRDNGYMLDISITKNVLLLDVRRPLGKKKDYDVYKTLNSLNMETWVGNGKHHLVEKEGDMMEYWFTIDMFYTNDKIDCAKNNLNDWFTIGHRAMRYGFDVLSSDTEEEAMEKIKSYAYNVITPAKSK